MFDINTKVQWRTGGRGVFRIVKGTVIATVKAGKLPIKSMQDKVPHGDKPSNRDRYIVAVKDDVFAWANLKTTYKQGEKMPKHVPRLGVPSKPKGKAAKKVAKKVAKVKAKAKTVAKAKKVAAVKVVAKKDDRMVQPKPVKKDNPKTTWYGIVDGKIVSVRKVVCPAGFSKDKPTLPEKQPEAPAAEAPAAPAAAAEAPAALPQAE
jgi:hypothetical protein